MKILFVSNLYPPEVLGGYEILCARVAAKLQAQGHRVAVLTSGKTPQLYAERTGESGEAVYPWLELYLDFGHKAGLERERRQAVERPNRLAAARALARFEPQAVLVWSQLRLGLGASRELEALGVPVVYTMNDDHILGFAPGNYSGPKGWLRYFLEGVVFPASTWKGWKAEQVLCISQSVKDGLAKKAPRFLPSTLAMQGIPVELFPQKPQPGTAHQPFRVLYAGQLHAYKGVHTLLEAVSLAGAENYHITVAGAGDPIYEERLRTLAKAGKLDCTFLGRVVPDSMPQVYRDADVLAFTSVWAEPFGMTHLEAMASGTPVVSVAHGGPGEFLRHEDNALLFEKEDAAGLADKLERLRKESALRMKLAVNGRRTVEDFFTVDHYANRLLDALKETADAQVKNIVHVPRRFVREAWGGTETVVLELAKRQKSLGIQAAIFTSMALSNLKSDEIQGVPVQRFFHFYPFWGLSADARAQMDRKGGNLFSWGLLNALQKRKGLDLLHLHTGKRLGALVRTAARRRGVPYLVQLHGGVASTPESELKDLSAPGKGTLEWGKVLGLVYGGRRVLQDADAILCVDRFEAESYRKLYPAKVVEFLPNGVDPSLFRPEDPQSARTSFRQEYSIRLDVPLMLCVGRIDPQKNQALALEVLALLKTKFPGLHLALAGPVTNPEYKAQLENKARELELGKSLVFLGQLDYHNGELARAYAAADVFLLPSIHEPFGVVILEAWAANLPVVASAVGGVPAFVQDGIEGLLFPKGGAQAAADAVQRILESPALAQSLKHSAKDKMVADYTWDKVAGKVQEIYGRVLLHKALKKRHPKGFS